MADQMTEILLMAWFLAYASTPWALEGGQGRPWTPWILKISAKKVVFLVSSGKNQISPLLALL